MPSPKGPRGGGGGGQFDLNEDQRAIRDMTAAFAAERVAPFALDWDRERHFPADVIRETGPLGFGGIYVAEDVGGSGLGRLDAVLIFEELAAACPAFSSFISIHNYGRLDDRHLWRRGPAPAPVAETNLHGMAGVLCADRAGLGLGCCRPQDTRAAVGRQWQATMC